MLDGRIDRPRIGTPVAAVLFAHCFTCTKQSIAATRISEALAMRGIAVLRFDFTGLGGSGGEFANAGFASNVEDLVAAARALEALGMPPAVLVGHSLGGAAVIAAAEHIASAQAVVTLGAPFEVDHSFQHFGDAIATIEQEGVAEVEIASRTFRISKDFLEQGRMQPQAQRLAALGKALLVLHAPTDELVGIENARQIYEAALHPKSFIALDGADHLLTGEGDAAYAAALIASWAAAYLPPAPTETRDLPGTVQVETAGGKFTQFVRTPSHEFLADEPASYGGDNLGPTPYDMLLAALGTCTSMTMQMYAERKKWPLERVIVDLEHTRDHHKDCTDCEDGEAIQAIDRALTIIGELDDEQRARLVEIADKCPVHRTLEGELRIYTTRVD
ncbi:bifunctional alpha/beta hydrolase/OsmC family protein [Paraurantiacibacter namhicola]|uniref:Alpha/beta hydrolase family protein n=1 Tax=Paraurantiacibacter namhicola TaxID=645517 RepID=A0A1C7DA60_9SPHN|nr:bifunctional alpha/beta hydrolase/OsmC family protein [Paraurantiacibacter namhicola]ANU08370.1 Alpha/beta hydrolase family protein [Paraurantiacibacter namhicola]